MPHEQRREQRNKDVVRQYGSDSPSAMPAIIRTATNVAMIAIFTIFFFPRSKKNGSSLEDQVEVNLHTGTYVPGVEPPTLDKAGRL